MGFNDAGSRTTAALVILHGYISIGKWVLRVNARKIQPDGGGVAPFSDHAILPYSEFCPLA